MKFKQFYCRDIGPCLQITSSYDCMHEPAKCRCAPQSADLCYSKFALVDMMGSWPRPASSVPKAMTWKGNIDASLRLQLLDASLSARDMNAPHAKQHGLLWQVAPSNALGSSTVQLIILSAHAGLAQQEASYSDSNLEDARQRGMAPLTCTGIVHSSHATSTPLKSAYTRRQA